MMKRSGQADLPLHSGRVPAWLYERMAKMARAITEAVLADYGKEEFVRKVSDPFWFLARRGSDLAVVLVDQIGDL